MTVDEAIRIAKAEAKDPYARSYLEALPDSIEESGSEGFKTQLLYALNNMKTWRGDRAREVKKVLLSYAKNPRKGMHTMYARVVNIRNKLSNGKYQVVVSRKSGRAFTDEQFKKAWNTESINDLTAAGWVLSTTYETLVIRGIKVDPEALEVGLDHTTLERILKYLPKGN
jgi:triphosphoribosyl-dephospho-CoA synthetase